MDNPSTTQEVGNFISNYIRENKLVGQEN